MNPRLLFISSCVALATTAACFSLRGDVMPAWARHFAITQEEVGAVGSAAFLGFALSVGIGSPLCDFLGMRKLLFLAFAGHLLGTGLTLLAPSYSVLLGASFLIGLANGLTEAVINPLIATLYPDRKTHKLNVLHAWWPGGLILAGMAGYALTRFLGLDDSQVSVGAAALGWRIKMALIFIPALIYGALLLGARFPATERVASGVPAREMLRECVRPMFLLWFFSMWLTAATELGPAQWVPSVLTKTAHTPGILVFVYVNVLLFGMRSCAGRLVHGRSPIAVLWASALLSAIGLFALSLATTAVAAYAAATVWGVGVCFFWPTMLGVTSEQFPRGGALLLGLMGTAGNLAIFFVMPILGGIWDHYTQRALPPAEDLRALILQASSDPRAAGVLEAARAEGAAMPFRWAAILPLILLVVFGLLWLRDRARGGYRVVRLEPLVSNVTVDVPPGE
ncbi:MAG TPA: MFS transporter [Planctomycetota bacterium]|nr:MFS transporter [Planctomycetota bacterium]